MQRYMVNNKELKLDIDDIKHIINVMRMKENEVFEIVYNKTIYTCKITHIDKKDVKYEIIKEDKKERNRKNKVIIACSLIKEQKMDYLLQKATELGVDEIIPLISQRTVVKVNDKKDNKLVRWNKIVKEASEQSFRIDIPKIQEITRLKDIIKYDGDIKIVCDTLEMSKNIKKVLQDSKKSDTILIVVGPEGGFTKDEVNYLSNNGFIRTSLGNNILRAETVPLFLLSVINYEFEVDL